MDETQGSPPADPPGDQAAPGLDPLAAVPRPEPVSPELTLALESRDCRVVAEAYLRAIERRAFGDAARFWNDPVIDGERLAALFGGYVTPRIDIADMQEEGAAGSLLCTLSGTLIDASDPRVAPAAGEIVLHRVNDVPGASASQLRWTLHSSSYIEPMERSRRG